MHMHTPHPPPLPRTPPHHPQPRTPPPPAPNPLQELATISDAGERAAAEKRVKVRTLGTVRLIAELFKQDVVRDNIIVVCLRELLESGGPKAIPPEVRVCLWAGSGG